MEKKSDTRIITTQRLCLRPLVEADAPRIAELAGHWDVASMTSRIPYPYSPAQAHQWIGTSDPHEFVRGIEYQGELVGVCGFMPTGSQPGELNDENGLKAEIGYWIGKAYWGQGIATEAARAILDECKKLRATRIEAGHFHDNPASARVLAKLGFQHVGEKEWWAEARQCNVLAIRYELTEK